MKTVRIFVYGTLRKGYWNHRLIGRAQGRVVTERVTLSDHALHATGLPYVHPAEGHKVVGEVHEIPEANLFMYDRLEGYNPELPDDRQYGYIRRLVALDDGTEAFAYIGPKGSDKAPLVKSGDYTDHRPRDHA